MQRQCVASIEEARHAGMTGQEVGREIRAEQLAPEFQGSLLSPAGIDQVFDAIAEDNGPELFKALADVVNAEPAFRSQPVNNLIYMLTSKADAMAYSIALQEAERLEKQDAFDSEELRAAG